MKLKDTVDRTFYALSLIMLIGFIGGVSIYETFRLFNYLESTLGIGYNKMAIVLGIIVITVLAFRKTMKK